MKSVQPRRKVFFGIVISAALFASQTDGVTFNDGGVHDVNSSYPGEIVNIRNSFWDEPTTVNLLAGGFFGVVHVRQDSYLNVVGGDITVEVQLQENATITITAGEASQIRAYDSSQVIIEGGWAGGVYFADDSLLRWTGGYIGGIILEANVGPIIVGGEIGSNIQTQPGSELHIVGGSIGGNVYASTDSSVEISNGQIEGMLDIQVDALVIVYGESFLIDQHPVSGTITNPLPIINYGHLTGQFLNGDPIDLTLKMDPNASITLTSEPGTIPPKCLAFPRMDFDKDCKVGFTDLALFLDEWLDCNLEPATACFE